MDEVVWIVVGIIASLLAIGIIANIALKGQEGAGISNVQTALDALAAHCEHICRLTENSAASIDVEFPAEVVLTTEDELICAVYREDRSCRRCSCDHGPPGNPPEVVLDLTEAGDFFRSHTYSCRYTRLDTGNLFQHVQLTCSG